MLKLFASFMLLVLFAIPASCGELFDDYLNYVRPGISTGVGDISVEASLANKIGQSFVVPDNTGEIYRIGIRPVYETWQEGEVVTMTLYQGKSAGNKIGEYSIDHSTSGIMVVHDTKDRILWFQFRAKTNGEKDFYFELSTKGGDGKVAFNAFRNNVVEGSANGQAEDLSFEVHIKPVADKTANLRKFFYERLNINLPELAAVKAAADKHDWENAIAELVKHFHNRMDIWGVWKDEMNVKIDPNADTKTADLLMKNQLTHKETGQILPWRPESYWVPEYPAEREQPAHSFNPAINTWHIDRTLGTAYTLTGKKEYARKIIDLRMQFILDNPSPKQSGLPRYHELWNDRTAAARAPGHGTLPYARLYNYDGWTNDEKLVFFSFLEDNADWVYQATSGANWGAEAATACYEFGLKFPEWSMSKKYVSWGTSRLAEITLNDVRGDGVSTEAAVKYHAMVARRLLGMIDDHKAGSIKLEDDMYKRLSRVVEGMYDHMAWSLQPNNYTVMTGDSFYENFSGEVEKVGNIFNRSDLKWIASQGKNGSPPKELARVYPESGYFMMRTNEPSEKFTDARHMLIHNGSWFGSHGHWDLTSINLYAYGRTLIVDPGQYDYEPPEGYDRYWNSKVHSMMVARGRDVKRNPAHTNFAWSPVFDWFDGNHDGYSETTVKRKVAFVRPNYFIVDDSTLSSWDTEWAQVWNVNDPNAVIDSSNTINTTYKDNGNLLIISQDPGSFSVERVIGMTAAKQDMPQTSIFRFKKNTPNPRFTTLLYPYSGVNKPNVNWERIMPDNQMPNTCYSLRITTDKELDWVVFGEDGKTVSYRNGNHKVNADFALLRMNKQGKVNSFGLSFGRQIIFNGTPLINAIQRTTIVSANLEGDKLSVTVKDPEPSLAIATLGAKRFELNGKAVTNPVIRNGMFMPYSDQPMMIVADNLGSFQTIIGAEGEWTQHPDPGAWGNGYLQHETDPGRHESGVFIINVPKTGTYSVEVSVPNVTRHLSERIEYTFDAMGKAVNPSGCIVESSSDGT
ncbi:MAG: heparinase II/III family protein, partial [Armatimonadota bacterium]